MAPTVSFWSRMATKVTIHKDAGLAIATMCSLVPLVEAAKIPIRRLVKGDFSFGIADVAHDCINGFAVLTASPSRRSVDGRTISTVELFTSKGAIHHLVRIGTCSIV